MEEVVNGGWTRVDQLIPSEIDIFNIKQIYWGGSNFYFLKNDGTVYATGRNIGIGNNLSSGDIIGFQEITTLPEKIASIYGNTVNCATNGCVQFIGMSGKRYSTGNAEILFKDNILQKSWKLIAKNVKKFKAQSVEENLAYIDYNNDIWILGNSSTALGIGDTEDKVIDNFVRMKDYLKEQDIYNHIDGKVIDYAIGSGPILYIRTDTSDNNTIYGCGKTTCNSWYNLTRLGIEEDAYVPKKIIDNVKLFSVVGLNRFALTNNNELYTWGLDDGYSLGNKASVLPTLNVDKAFNTDSIVKICAWGYQSYIYTKENDSNEINLYVTGSGIGHSTACNGYGNTLYKWTKFDNNDFFDGNSIIDLVGASHEQTFIALASNGKLYGWGASSLLGLGTTSTVLNRKAIEINTFNNKNEKIQQIIGGNGFFIIVTEDGKVYGTGSNQYGILGRWIGVDRKTPNSRYKTAFDWVECPELEI